MLHYGTDYYCGVFDTALTARQSSPTEEREVKTYEIELYENDGGTSFIDQRGYGVKGGMLICVKPGQIRHSIFPLRCRYLKLNPQKPECTELCRIIDQLPECVYLQGKKDIDELTSDFSSLISLSSAHDDGGARNTLLANSFLYKILFTVRVLSMHKEPSVSSTSRIVTEAKKYINQNYMNSCSLDKLALALNVSANHIRFVFKEKTGISPYEYTIAKRISEAKALIADGRLSMLEIALQVGFCSQSHFNKIFKEQTSKTPTEYRSLLLSYYKKT